MTGGFEIPKRPHRVPDTESSPNRLPGATQPGVEFAQTVSEVLDGPQEIHKQEKRVWTLAGHFVQKAKDADARIKENSVESTSMLTAIKDLNAETYGRRSRGRGGGSAATMMHMLQSSDFKRNFLEHDTQLKRMGIGVGVAWAAVIGAISLMADDPVSVLETGVGGEAVVGAFYYLLSAVNAARLSKKMETLAGETDVEREYVKSHLDNAIAERIQKAKTKGENDI